MMHLVTVHNYYYPSSFIYHDEQDAINKYNQLIASEVQGHIIRSKIEDIVFDSEICIDIENEVDWT